MDKKPERLKVSEIDKAREVIARGIVNDTYRLYAVRTGPLTVDQVSDDLRRSPDYIEVVSYLGWPGREDASIEPTRQYEDNESFLVALLGEANDSPAELNNFALLISQTPTLEPHSKGEGMKGIYARMPALHRLYVLMPELSHAVRSMFVDIKQRHGFDKEGADRELSLDKNNDLITGLRMMYTVLGRLFTVHDLRLQSTLTFPNQDASNLEDITSAFVALRT